MKFLPFLLLLLMAVGCHSQNQPTAAPTTNASLKDLHWQLRDLLRMQLPVTMPDARNGKQFKKSYSLDYRPEGNSFTLELPEKQHDMTTEAVAGGSKYYLPFQNIDVKNLRIVTSDDQQTTAIVIPAKQGTTFVYRPYTNDPDEQVTAVTIGWYDRVQDRTLARGLALWQQFLAKMESEAQAGSK
ncbi:MAG: hypothetical protein HY842_15855 [Bacteroidetes bacterium]|nr:hypothetical protein [Bacteroidota bacterium]